MILLKDSYNDFIIGITSYLPILLKKIILLVIIFISYRPVRNICLKSTKYFLKEKKIDELLISFIDPTITVILLIFYGLNIISIFGLKTASVLALLGSLALGVGLALKGSFSDIAGGIQILVSKPFKKGDFIVACNVEGGVQKISFLYTVLNSVDNKKIIIPNGKLSTSVITNVTSNFERRMDFTFFADKKISIDKVKEILYSVVKEHPLVLKEKDIFVKFSKETNSATEYIVRAWVLKENFRDVSADIQENVKKRFDEEEIRLPYTSYEIEIKNSPKVV